VYCQTEKCFYVVVVKNPVNELYEATENELQKSSLTISKNATRVLKVTDLEISPAIRLQR
jgi:hypothetical protein